MNYRPISIIPYLAKLFELIVYSIFKRSLNYSIMADQHDFSSDKFNVTSNFFVLSLF